MNSTKNFLWIIPFFSFTLGYWIMHNVMHISEITIPTLVGKQVHMVLPLITQYNLNLRLIDQKEEMDLPEGVILNQTPAVGTRIKQNQPVFIVTTKKPEPIQTPQCVGLSIDEIYNQLQSQSIYPRVYYVSHSYPEKYCFAQSPQYNRPLENNKIILYVSSGNKKPIIWPDFTHLPLSEVIDFLHYYHIEPYIINDYEDIHYACAQCVVIDQRPFAGTLVTLDENKPLSVQLRVRTIG